MAMVAVEKLEPGMILASGVHDKCGRLLLGEGAELAMKHIFIFRTWGVVEADIVGVDVDETSMLPDDISVEEMNEMIHALLPSYRHSDIQHPATRELLHLAALRMVTHDRT